MLKKTKILIGFLLIMFHLAEYILDILANEQNFFIFFIGLCAKYKNIVRPALLGTFFL